MSTNGVFISSWRRRTAGALITLALTVAGVFGVAGAAAAAPSDCGVGYHCTYSGYNYGNDAWQQPSTHKFLHCVDEMYIGWRSYMNVASSAFNDGRLQTSYLYAGAKKTGKWISFGVGKGTANLGTRDFNDTAASGYFSSTLGSSGSALCR